MCKGVQLPIFESYKDGNSKLSYFFSNWFQVVSNVNYFNLSYYGFDRSFKRWSTNEKAKRQL
jgi:hypothetical protein